MSWSAASVVRERAAADPTEPIFTSADGEAVSARAFDERTSQVGRALVAAGIGPGDRVGFLGRNELAWYELFYGAAKAGVVAVGLNWRLSGSELAAIAADAQVRAVAAGPGFDAAARSLAPLFIAPNLWSAWRDAHPPEDPGFEAEPDDVALQLYTSGTTGDAKGVLLSNRAVEATLGVARRWHLGTGSTALVNLPLFHFGGSGWPLWALALGARCVVHREVDASLAVASFRSQVTTTLAVPQILRLLCDEADRAGGGFSSLRCIGYGSAPISEALILRTMRTFDCELLQTYGMTETCGIITQLGPDEHDPDGPRRHLLRSAGRAVPGVEIFVGDRRSGVPVAGGEVGDVWVRAPWLMTGYWAKAEETAAVLTADGWLATGDMGFVDEGYLYLTDRATDMIISGGENVYPVEVEAVLARHPAVVDVAAFGVPDDTWGETVVAVVVPAPGESPEPDVLIRYARDHLAHYKCPSRVEFADALPRNPTGKVLRRDLRAQFIGVVSG